MKNTALITGASGGIGKELALIHAEKGGDLVLVARSREGLEKVQAEIQQRFDRKVEVIVADLTSCNSPEMVFRTVSEKGIVVETLINNAGVGGFGEFHQRAIDEELNMMHLNMDALVQLTHLFLPGMIERRKGRILNVSSIAGFIPGPLMTTYYASKAFVNSFSFGLAQEVRKYGITVTALCPGPLKTNFNHAAGMSSSSLFQKAPGPKATALKGYRAMEKGRLKALTNFPMRLGVAFFVPFTPLRLILSVMEMMHKK